MIKILDTPLDPQEAIRAVQSDSSGAVNLFIGTVRSRSRNKNVIKLEYEVYEAMAISEIEKIASDAKNKWPIDKVLVYHRKGSLKVGDIAVIIAVSTAHRKDSFEACQYIIDTLKQTAPIWKKEAYDSGETWVDAHP